MVGPRFYTAQTAVRFCHEVPDSLGSLMVEFMVWDHMTSVRFTLERPTSSTGGGAAQRTGLQIPKVVSSNLTLCSTQTESNAAGMVLRLALKTRFSEMGWGSTPLLSANNMQL